MFEAKTLWSSKRKDLQTSNLWSSRSWLKIWKLPLISCRIWREALVLKSCKRLASSEGWETNLRKSLTQSSSQTLWRHTSQLISQRTFRTSRCSPFELKQVWWSMTWRVVRRTMRRCSKKTRHWSMSTESDNSTMTRCSLRLRPWTLLSDSQANLE